MTADEDDEYELEPIDPEILEMERQRTAAKIRQAQRKVDINEVYDDEQVGENFTFDDLQGFRFTVRHLLIGTAAVAIFLTLFKLGECMGLFLGGLALLAAGWFYVLQKEKRERLARQQGREAFQKELDREETGGVDYSEFDETEAATPRSEFRFSFSMKELFGAMTVAAVLMGLIQLVGGTHNAALVLGVIALAGLAIHLLGYDPPKVVVLGWWLLIVMYIVVSLWAAFGGAAA